MSELQLFDALAPHIEDALRASMSRFGVIVPVVRDQDGRIVDGHHRVRLAEELGIAYPERHVTVADDDEAREIARTLNADRRHLTDEQRREIAADLRREGHSERAIAGALGTSQATVHRDLKRVEIDSGESISPERVKRQGGGSYPATRPVSAPPEEIEDQTPLTLEPDVRNEPPVDVPPAPEPNTWYGGPPEPAFAPPPRAAPPVLTDAEREERLRLVAKQEYLNAYSEAVDGLLALESYGAAYTPPADIPENYPAVASVVARLEAVLSTWKTWSATR